ncbi:MAG: glycerophosphoryl diester phosphodiesterase membrane domain-containing protein [Alphaproteobacteria bacterium]|nr:glycerophosphoryl diester phosphodiesterase membrane domain-containing protein [Alphaproteobacteria bacterium]
MKLDLSAAWDGAMAMIRANREVVLVLTGVFFFLPYLAFSLFLPDTGIAEASAANETDMDAIAAIVMEFYAEFWWALLLLALIQAIGGIASLAVLGDNARPTVGDAIRRGVTLLPTQVGAQIVAALAIFAPIMLASGIGAATGSPAIAGLLTLIALPILIYIAVKLSLTSPAVAIDQLRNPLTALARSWRLTRRNSFRLFFFFLLLIVAFVVASTVLNLIIGLVLALLGEELQLIGLAISGALINAIFSLIAYAVLASVHQQLAGQASASVPRAGGED